jgi:predicted enzyme related to lactoylglutathione lyase
MLKDAEVLAMVAVSDVDAGKQFYGETLGLTQTDEDMGGVTYSSGSGRLFMYQAPTAGKNQATSATWEVEDIAAVVNNLKAKNVPFEHYEFPGVTYKGDVHVMGGMKAAWFKDPDGNILGLGEVQQAL